MIGLYHQNTRSDLYRGHSLSVGSKKKIGNFSYSASDKIGKGFSSVVYKGINDATSIIYIYIGETVAIKAIDMKGIRDHVSREMLDC